jgi:hypothetical protein
VVQHSRQRGALPAARGSGYENQPSVHVDEIVSGLR